MKPFLLSVLCFLTIFATASAQDLDPEQDKTESQPVLQMGVSYIVDFLRNVSGGVEEGSELLGSLLVEFDFDASRAWGWDGSGFHLGIFAIHGGPFTRRVGDFQTVSNIEAPQTINLFEAYYQQEFDKFTSKIGLIAIDTDFDIRSSAGLFVHSSPATGGDIGQLGENGPGIFPVGALGVQLRYENQGHYAQAAVIEGIPGDPDSPFGNTFTLGNGEGAFLIGELGHTWQDEIGELGKVSVGAWGFTEGFATHSVPDAQASNQGAYLSLEKTLYRESEDPDQGLSAFLRTGFADGSVNPIQTYVGGGLVYTGAFPGRDADQLGFAFSSGLSSSEFQNAAPQQRDDHETALELTYSFVVNNNLSVQPGLQYIVNPGFDPTLNDALVLGLRATASFDTP